MWEIEETERIVTGERQRVVIQRKIAAILHAT